MKNKKPQRWIKAVLALIALVLVALVLPPLPKPKARASRIQTVNHVASVSMTMASTNALPNTTTK